MLRNPALRSTLRSLTASPTKALRPVSRVTTPQNAQLTSRLCTLSSKRPQIHSITLQKLNSTISFRQATTKPPVDKIDTKSEEKAAGAKLGVDKEHVTSDSSVHPLFTEVGTPNPEPDTDMSAGIYADIVCVPDVVVSSQS
jgi:hypothetical protein